MPKLWPLIFIYLIMAGRWADLRGAAVDFDLRTTPDDNLRMRAGAPFKVALFADLHFGENAWTDWGPLQDVKSVRVMSSVLDKEQPDRLMYHVKELDISLADFVVYLGDVITANNIMVKNASLYWDQAISPTRERGISWCTIFGNHDDAPFEWPLEWFSETGIPPLACPVAKTVSSGCGDCSFQGTTRKELMKSEIEKKGLSYSKSGPHDLWPSVSNYALKILSADSQRAVAYFYFFDSGGGSYPEVISNAQVKWFESKSGDLNPDSSVPELIFWHIPTGSYRDMSQKSNGSSYCVGSIFAENVAAQESEMGIMQVLEQRSSVKAVFVGHNHGLDWCCPHTHLWLCFARHTGYGGYGNWARGARILEINEHPFSLKSWITMEDGTSHSEVILSS